MKNKRTARKEMEKRGLGGKRWVQYMGCSIAGRWVGAVGLGSKRKKTRWQTLWHHCRH